MHPNSFFLTTSASKPGYITLLMEGQLTVKNAAAIKMELLSAAGKKENIEIVLQNITKMDLAFLQLLVALQKKLTTVSKKLFINTNNENYISNIIKQAGLENFLITSKATADAI